MTVGLLMLLMPLSSPVSSATPAPDVTVPRTVSGVLGGREAVTPEPVRDVWHELAVCESGMNGQPRWQANTGNSFYGGLQFTQQSWEWAGGLAFASRADLASPGQQVEVAERLRQLQGWGAWPVCSVKVGLRP